MEEELLAGVPCSSRAVESVIRVSTVIIYKSLENLLSINQCLYVPICMNLLSHAINQAGGLYGFCAGPHNARKLGIKSKIYISVFLLIYFKILDQNHLADELKVGRFKRRFSGFLCGN